jgi:hypothetical protein
VRPISDEDRARLEREDVEAGHLLANVLVTMAKLDHGPGPIEDERGRLWGLPTTDVGLLQDYTCIHGRLSPAVDQAFQKVAGGYRELRMLMVRNTAAGESVNVAARALARGPFPLPVAPSRPRARPGDTRV